MLGKKPGRRTLSAVFLSNISTTPFKIEISYAIFFVQEIHFAQNGAGQAVCLLAGL
jgi:hypothetical protein